MYMCVCVRTLCRYICIYRCLHHQFVAMYHGSPRWSRWVMAMTGCQAPREEIGLGTLWDRWADGRWPHLELPKSEYKELKHSKRADFRSDKVLSFCLSFLSEVWSFWNYVSGMERVRETDSGIRMRVNMQWDDRFSSYRTSTIKITPVLLSICSCFSFKNADHPLLA